jgi:hypothetical protein
MTDEEPQITVKKMTGYLQVPNEILADMGLIPWVWNKPYEPTRRERFRRWRSELRERIAVRLYERVSGENMPDPSDWDDS